MRTLERLESRHLMAGQNAVVVLPAGFDPARYADIGPQSPAAAISTSAQQVAEATSLTDRFASTVEFEDDLLAQADRLFYSYFGQTSADFPPFMLNRWPGVSAGAEIYGRPGFGQQGSMAGIDQPQPFASDGQFFYLLQDGELLIFTAAESSAPALISRTKIEGYAPGLYLDGDRLIIVSQDYGRRFLDSGFPSKGGGFEKEATNLIVLDISDRAAPALVSQTDFDGYLFEARRIDGRIYLTLASDLEAPAPLVERIDHTAEGGGLLWTVESRDDYQERVRPLLAALLPHYKQRSVGETGSRQPMTEASRLYKSTGDIADIVISVVAIDPRADKPVPQAAASVLGSVEQTIYASANNFYLFEQRTENGQDSFELRKFRYTATGVELVASAQFAGSLAGKPNEHGGLLQLVVAHKDGSSVRNGVLVLGEQGTELAVVGELRSFAPGVQFANAQFIGSRGFVFASYSAGPLFTLDLSDPTNPRVAAAPDLPGLTWGFHPLDATTLLSISRETDPITAQLHTIVGLYDVSDIAAPQLKGQVRLSPGEWTDAAWDRNRILWDSQSRTIALPTIFAHTETPIDADGDGVPESWQSHQDRSLAVLEVGPSLELTLRGQTIHDREVLWSARVGDAIYSITPDTVRVSSLSQPTTTLGEADYGRAFVGKQVDPFHPDQADLLILGGYQDNRFEVEPFPDGRLEVRQAGAIVGTFDLDEIRAIILDDEQGSQDRILVKNWRGLPAELNVDTLAYRTDIGDADRSGLVDLADFALLKSQFGRQGEKLAGDIDRDGDVDLADLGILRSNFGLPAQYSLNFNEIVLPDGTIGKRPLDQAALAIDFVFAAALD
jgi:hypothetical protein